VRRVCGGRCTAGQDRHQKRSWRSAYCELVCLSLRLFGGGGMVDALNEPEGFYVPLSGDHPDTAPQLNRSRVSSENNSLVNKPQLEKEFYFNWVQLQDLVVALFGDHCQDNGNRSNQKSFDFLAARQLEWCRQREKNDWQEPRKFDCRLVRTIFIFCVVLCWGSCQSNSAIENHLYWPSSLVGFCCAHLQGQSQPQTTHILPE